MATYYWVGGSGTWNNATTTNWASSSGGAGGAGVPTNADTAIFDTASAGANYTVTVAATAVSLSTTVANPTGGVAALSLSGAPTLCTPAGTFTFTSGTITLNNNNLSVGIFSCSNSNTRSIAFGSGNIILTSTTAATIVLAMATATGFTKTGTGGFSRNQAATATVQFGSTAGGSATNAPNLLVTAGSGALTITANSWFNNIDFTGSTCTVTAASTLNISGNLTLATGGTYTAVVPTFRGTGTVITNGKTIGVVVVDAPSGTVTLGGALTNSGAITFTSGTFTTSASNFTLTSTQIIISGGTLTLNGSTVALSSATPFAYSSGTLNAGTSQINLSGTNLNTFSGGDQTYYNVSFTGNTSSITQGPTINGANTFNNLTVAPRTATIGIGSLTLSANQTVNGTLTFAGNADAGYRMAVKSNTLGTTCTLTCAAVSLVDVDFQDITGAGAAAPFTGTRLGDAKGNSGITFPAAKTVYWNLAVGGNWSSTAWAASSGASPATANFPLAQDTAVFQATGLNSGSTITINSSYFFGTINMSARTSNTMTLLGTSVFNNVVGNWINGTGVTIDLAGAINVQCVQFCGRGSQTITSAGVANNGFVFFNSPGGTVTLQDNLVASNNQAQCVTLINGTLNLNGKTLSITGALGTFFTAAGTKNLTFNGGSLVIAASGSTAFNNASPTGFTTTAGTGVGSISLTSASSKTFVGGGSTYNCSLNQGGAGQLTITGANTFSDITNTYGATGAATIRFPDPLTTTVAAFTAAGTAGKVLSITSTNTATQAVIDYTGVGKITTGEYLTIVDLSFTPFVTNGTAPYQWYAGANFTNGGRNLGILFADPATTTAYLLLSGTSWTVPADWISSNNSISLIGGGAGGTGSNYISLVSKAAGKGGGGGGYRGLTNQSLTPSASIPYAIGDAGTAGTAGGGAGGTGGTTSWNTTNTATGGSSTGGGTGTFSGGAPGLGGSTASSANSTSGGGGGGAGGPNGVGGNGGQGIGNSNATTAGGGGGNGGGSSATVIGVGGNNFLGTGGGSTNTVGTNGGGGGGGGGGLVGQTGGIGYDLSNTTGGGGGAGGAGGTTVSTGFAGGTSLAYGGGGGGGSTGTTGGSAVGGAGGQGMIFIVYSSAVFAVGNFFMMF